MATRKYSRLKKIESKKYKRTAVFFVFLTIVAIILMAIFGFTALVKFTGFLGSVNNADKINLSTDNTPPAPPIIPTPPKATNQSSFKIEGSAESGAKVILTLNRDQTETLVTNSGDFNFSIDLVAGDNEFFLKTIDPAGNESQQTKTYLIIFDNKDPLIDITKPSDGQQFYGQPEQKQTIEGKTEEGAQVTINDSFVIVESDGTFKFDVTLSEDTNEFTIKSTDQAGNSTEEKLTVTYTP